MPELAEVEIVRRNLEGWWTEPASEVRLLDDELLVRGDPQTLRGLLTSQPPEMGRRGKYLLAGFDDGAIVFHFRMTGKIVLAHQPEPDYARLSWRVDPGWLVFKDRRRLGRVEVFEDDAIDDYEPLTTMGPEPWDLTGELLRDRLSQRRRLKDALMDQSSIAGVGNIAVSELFWRLKLPPDAQVSDLDDDDFEALAAEIPTYFDDIIDREMADEVTYVEEDSSANPFDVYGREGGPCPRCGTEIAREKIAGRSSYFCPQCQS